MFCIRRRRVGSTHRLLNKQCRTVKTSTGDWLHFMIWLVLILKKNMNIKKLSCLTVLAFVFITSCTKSSGNPDDNNNGNNAMVVPGNYIITQFTDNNPDEDNTSDFNGYAFTFSADGKIVAVKTGVTTEGSYNETPSHENEGAKLTINFNDAPLNKLNKKWLINAASADGISLSDDDNSGEVLIFLAQ